MFIHRVTHQLSEFHLRHEELTEGTCNSLTPFLDAVEMWSYTTPTLALSLLRAQKEAGIEHLAQGAGPMLEFLGLFGDATFKPLSGRGTLDFDSALCHC